ncbi:MAG: 30S ribosomal protein S4 [Candidatus Staskawiczbacteria bacterium RIFCSPHIGHO2_02_FULL_34_10]|uniref:Small ribosomal subunit protein uS4 n=2 Tax=Candidatus Staskawicziibacteriota TaxID=1817916 RepID=A0A1G2HJM2_9BACT|nr:MAG: 30S ribosomal protein S4 [Candidatus Staskawiczbacteria bacterium RIFCSPHIGHO2_01_FULL_34_27]OGZ67794.1 MAG: 30S ribosomal protein S4 [Candidatus Staskawiczbacteria bacterium RIFCSPHIGHO2_02_FULL_34_10]
MADQFKSSSKPSINADPFTAKKTGILGQGMERRKRTKAASEYKKSLQEKQTLKRLYGLSERQFKRYVKEALEKMQRVENVSDELIKNLEKRLDNVVFRLGFSKSRSHARQLVNHSYFLVNGKPVNIPSYQVNKGDIIIIKETKKKKIIFKDLPELLKPLKTHVWLDLNKDKFEGKVIGNPSLAEVAPPVEISLVFEFYSR